MPRRRLRDRLEADLCSKGGEIQSRNSGLGPSVGIGEQSYCGNMLGAKFDRSIKKALSLQLRRVAKKRASADLSYERADAGQWSRIADTPAVTWSSCGATRFLRN